MDEIIKLIKDHIDQGNLMNEIFYATQGLKKTGIHPKIVVSVNETQEISVFNAKSSDPEDQADFARFNSSEWVQLSGTWYRNFSYFLEEENITIGLIK